MGKKDVCLELDVPAATLWDMDGTLIDSDRLWVAAEERLCREHTGQELPGEARRALEGASLPECARVLQGVGVKLEAGQISELLCASVERSLQGGEAGGVSGIGQCGNAEEIGIAGQSGRPDRQDKQQSGHGIVWARGAMTLLRQLVALDVPAVLVTGTPMRIVRHVLAAIPADADAFQGRVITGDSPLPAKPAPDRYLAAARMAHADIHDCLVFEDSGTGITAGLVAGARVIALTALARTPAPESPHYPRIPDFRALTLR